ncbi:prolyl endopeptidase-like isoform X1 [Hibiscus syriacus]|uniref:Prolyl endopeptidase-like isoform X1 n=1 Tax=Hibiscus syriacus TaxID=106335 RepID=A0A6A3AK45_HIBSY|nr:prolyl endopeptidase-like isoform X1 [Hibiscus syriacus]
MRAWDDKDPLQGSMLSVNSCEPPLSLPSAHSRVKIPSLMSTRHSVCLDYCGFGLFSYVQTLHYWESSTFSLSEITANLSNHTLYGAAEKGTVEYDIKSRIMDYLNIPEHRYGLVFTSRVTGHKYSYQWMALAQQNNWHVLLDAAGSLGPKDMDSLGMSLFGPDFIITSFYRVFGYDPTGFGCLLIKKSVMGSLQNQSGSTGSGMVKITPDYPLYQSDSVDDLDELSGITDNEVGANGDKPSEIQKRSCLPFLVPTRLLKYRTYLRRKWIKIIVLTEMVQAPYLKKRRTPLGSDNAGQWNKQKISSPSPPFWFSGRKNHKQLSSKPTSTIYSSSIYDDKDLTIGYDNQHVLSFDSAIRSVSQELDRTADIPGEAQFAGTSIAPRNHKKASDGSHLLEIQEEQGTSKPLSVESVSSSSVFRYNGLTSEISSEIKDSAIRRETEGEFRLLGSREGNKYNGGEASGTSLDNEETSSDGEYGHGQDWDRREPEITCRHLDQINMLGLNKTSIRLRLLINWLVTSLLHLKLPNSDGDGRVNLVYIYGPKIKYERGAAVAFNVRDRNRGLINPEIVLKLA